VSGASDLSGVWHGIFNYPHSLPPAEFVATLVEHNGALSGETEETDSGGHRLIALLSGHRAGSSVSFVKTYDDRHTHAVHYAGTLDPEVTEIAGTWRIAGSWSGTFVMVRAAGKAEEVARKLAESVDR
jgi:hypothetical protein